MLDSYFELKFFYTHMSALPRREFLTHATTPRQAPSLKPGKETIYERGHYSPVSQSTHQPTIEPEGATPQMFRKVTQQGSAAQSYQPRFQRLFP